MLSFFRHPAPKQRLLLKMDKAWGCNVFCTSRFIIYYSDFLRFEIAMQTTPMITGVNPAMTPSKVIDIPLIKMDIIPITINMIPIVFIVLFCVVNFLFLIFPYSLDNNPDNSSDK